MGVDEERDSADLLCALPGDAGVFERYCESDVFAYVLDAKKIQPVILAVV